MKKVLMVGPTPPPFGGIAAVIDDIVRSELKTEYALDIFDRSDIGVQGFFGRNSFRAQRFYSYFQTLRRGKYAFAHIHSADLVFLGSLVFMLLNRLAGVKSLLHMHGTDWDEFYEKAPAATQAYIRRGLRVPDKIVVLYELWRVKILELAPSADVEVIRNLLHDPEPSTEEDRARARRDYGIPEDRFVVLTVGSVGHRKGSFDIMAAAPLVAAKDLDTLFVLVGGEELPGEMVRVRSLAAEVGDLNNVCIVGEVERPVVPTILSLADVFLLPSYIEGMPISIIEAMARKLPIISTQVGGIPEMVENGVSGILIDPGAPEQIADAVLKLSRDEEERRRLGTNARAVFEDKFEFSQGISELKRLYKEISA